MKSRFERRPPRPSEDVEQLKHEELYDGYFRMERYTLRHKDPAGNWTPAFTREVFERGHATAMLPYDPVRDEVVFIEQFRAGAYAAGMNPVIREIPAGIVDKGETPEDVVRREIMEEIGCQTGQIEPICEFLPSPGACSETVHMFCAQVDSTTTVDIGGVKSEHEFIKVIPTPVSEAFADLDAMRFNNSAVIIGLQWLRLHYDYLRKKWR